MRRRPLRPRFAILSALPEEWNAVVRRLHERVDVEDDRLPNVAFGHIGKNSVICVQCGKGEPHAATALTYTIGKWKPRWVLLVGVAGGYPEEDVHRGDVVVASYVYFIAYGKISKGRFKQRPEYDYRPDAFLHGKAAAIAEIDSDIWRKLISISRPDGKSAVASQIHAQTYIGSSDVVHDDPNHPFFVQAKRRIPELHAIEMEGAGAGTAIYQEQSARAIGILMVRGISDEPGNPGKDGAEVVGGRAQRKTWKPFASDAAAAFAECLVAKISQPNRREAAGAVGRKLISKGDEIPIQTRAAEIYEYKQNRRNELTMCVKLLYRPRYRGRRFPLVTKVEWIAKKPTPIDELDIFLQPKSKEDVPPFSMTIFDGKTCVEWSKKMNPEIELKDNYTYRLWKIVTIGGRVAFYFRPTSYFAFFNTCEALAFELAYWCYNNTPRAPIAIPRNLPHRGPSKHIFNLRSRNAALGLNVLSVFLNCRQGNRFYMQKRTTRKLAEGRNTITVVPSGTFQPDSYEGARGTDFSLRRAIFREFAEELLGRKEMERQAKHGQDFMNDKRLRPYLRAEQEGRLRIFFLGFGYDPVNGKGEMLLCIAMDANSIGISDFEKSLKSNWEGENFSVEWSKERLREFAARENTLGPGAACLDLVLRNFKKIDRLYFA